MQPFAYEIAERPDHLEIRGVSLNELTEALELVEPIRTLRAEGVGTRAGLTEAMRQVLELIRTLQADHVEAIRGDLLKVLMSREVSLNPPATVTQVQQLATHRAALLATPVFTHETLSELRGDKPVSSTRTWLARRRDAHALFTVSYNGRTLIPAFQLDERGEPRTELQPILSVLDEGGIQGWSLWTWLTKPTSFLSGGVPEEIARTEPDRVLHAAQRFAAGPIA
ncbi:hypothetical protein [Mycobacterium sp.]|uniref:hypothetical protein n=1 Tax=Mycobacterium sp. TaxID=1785 RepID=UPI003F9C137C